MGRAPQRAAAICWPASRAAAVSAAPGSDRSRGLSGRDAPKPSARMLALRRLHRFPVPPRSRPFPGPRWPPCWRCSAPPCSPRNNRGAAGAACCSPTTGGTPAFPSGASGQLGLYAAHGPRRGRGGVALVLESDPRRRHRRHGGFGSRTSPGISTSSPNAAPCSSTSAMFLLPVNLTADWDFPISHDDPRARRHLRPARRWWRWPRPPGVYRRRFPLAGYGYFVFLVLMSPTSSFCPLRTPSPNAASTFPCSACC